MWKIIIAIVILCFILSAIVLWWFFTKKRPIKRVVIKESPRDAPEPDDALKRWRFFVVVWPLTCMCFVGIISYQAIMGMEERAFDAGFALIPLVFFAIGMKMRYRLLKERRYASVLTVATVISGGRRSREGKRYFYPVYEFQAGGITYKVTSPSGYSVCFVGEGRQVELYYAPENPQLFYVPLMQKHDNRVSAFLCGIGIVWPLAGVFAPQIRSVFSFLYM